MEAIPAQEIRGPPLPGGNSSEWYFWYLKPNQVTFKKKKKLTGGDSRQFDLLSNGKQFMCTQKCLPIGTSKLDAIRVRAVESENHTLKIKFTSISYTFLRLLWEVCAALFQHVTLMCILTDEVRTSNIEYLAIISP